MSELTSPQRRAAIDALRLLCRTNIAPERLLTLESSPSPELQKDLYDDEEVAPSAAIQKAAYIPPEATYFTDVEQAVLAHRVTLRSFAAALIDHPEGAVVEYPKAGKKKGDTVAHRFKVVL